MVSSPLLNYHLQECESSFPSTKYGSSRRTPSLSSPSSSSLSSTSSINLSDDSSPTSFPTPLKLSGIPFSWEHLPGIPKKPNLKKKDSSLLVLPLPPPTSKSVHNSIQKKTTQMSFKDPFFAALVECSKDDEIHHESNVLGLWNCPYKVSRSISDRFGIISSCASCKRTCAVSESIVYIPRASRSYDLINRHRSS